MTETAACTAAASFEATSGLGPVNPNWLETNLPCRSACPVGTHAGGYVSLIAAGRYEEAYRLARRPNPFASVCGRICAHPCEAACRRGHVDDPISIRALKRFVTERYGTESEASFDEILDLVERPRPPATRDTGKVAVVGAGPAGLSCAHDLALMGHQAVVFDAAPVAGGMMRLGIPEYRLPRELIRNEIAFVQHLGVEIRLGVEIGKDVTFAALRNDYDAVFLAPGCRRGRGLNLPGMELEGVVTAVDFLVNANLGHPLPIGDDVVVVGGGNVAFDVARTARRFGGTSRPDETHHNLLFDAALTAVRTFGKRVTLLSLESRDEMPADDEEIEEAMREGIRLLHRRGPHGVLGNGRLRALATLDCTRVFDEDGRFAPEFDPESVKEVPCDTVIFAVGQVADLSFLGEDHGLEVTPRNTVAVDRETLATSQPDVWAGGDVAFGPRIVIEAVADGRRAARAIDTHLTGRHDEPPELVLRSFDTFGYEHPFAAGDYERLGRGTVPTLPVESRGEAAEVEVVYSEAEARHEGARCLHCWINTIFDSRTMSGSECIQCGGCVDVCPEDCIDLVSLLRLRTAREDATPLRLPDGRALELAGPGAAMIKDETTCIRCGLCARRCPVGCITMQGFYRRDEMDLLKLCETSL